MDLPKICAAEVNAHIAKCNNIETIAFQAVVATLSRSRSRSYSLSFDESKCVNRSKCTHPLVTFGGKVIKMAVN